MTTEEILAMRPGRDLDLLVCEKVFDNKTLGSVKPYSTDISAAWQVVLACPEMRITFHRTINPSLIEGSASLKRLPDGRLEWFYVVYEGHEVRTPEAPEAICKVALLAKLEVGE